jgi:cell division inhibitor SepF
MKVFDKFLDKMKLSSDEEYDEYDDDEDDYEAAPAPRKSKKSASEDIFEEKAEETPVYKQPKSKPAHTPSRTSNNKVVNMRKSYNANMEVCVFKPTNVDDGRDISDTLSSGKAVILNLEGLDIAVAQRIIDFTSGAVYSMNGKLENISNYIFIVTPESVDISGDFQEMFNNDFKFPTGNGF